MQMIAKPVADDPLWLMAQSGRDGMTQAEDKVLDQVGRMDPVTVGSGR